MKNLLDLLITKHLKEKEEYFVYENKLYLISKRL